MLRYPNFPNSDKKLSRINATTPEVSTTAVRRRRRRAVLTR